MFIRSNWTTQPPASVELPGAGAWLNGTTPRTPKSINGYSYIGSPVTTHTDAGRTFQYLEGQYININYPTNNGALPSNLIEATLIAVVKPLTASGNNDPIIIAVNSSSTPDTLFLLRYDISATKFWFQGRDRGSFDSFQLYQSGTSPLNQTYVVVGTHRNGRQRIYVNGVLLGTTATSFPDAFNFDRASFGGLDRGSPNALFEGFLPFAAIYPREFTQSEVTQLRTPKDVWKLFAPQPRKIWQGVGSGSNTYTLSVSGGVTFSGTVPLRRERRQVPSGGVNFSGTVSLRRERRFVPSGGVTFGGTAPIIFNAPNIYTITPSGGVTFSGAIALRRERRFVPAGGVTFSGTAPLVRTRLLIPSGQVTFSGSAPITFIPAGGSAYTEPLRITTGSARFVRVS